MYGCRLSEVLTLCHTSASLQGLCVALRARRPSASGWSSAPRPLVPRSRRRSRGRPCLVWPGLPTPRRATAGPTLRQAQERRGRLLLLARPLGGQQRRVHPCRPRRASGLPRPRPEPLGTRPVPRPLRGTCLERRRTRCTVVGRRRGGRPTRPRPSVIGGLDAAQWGRRWGKADRCPSVRVPTRTSGGTRAAPLGSPEQRRLGTDRHRREAGDSRIAAGHSPPEARPQARDTEVPRPTGALRGGPRLTFSASGDVGGDPPPGLPGDRLSARRLARRPTGDPLPPGDRLSVRRLARSPTGGLPGARPRAERPPRPRARPRPAAPRTSRSKGAGVRPQPVRPR